MNIFPAAVVAWAFNPQSHYVVSIPNIIIFRKFESRMSGRGRPRGSTKVGKGTSWMHAKCAVCTTVLRNDKIREHQIFSVLFDDEGNPADINHPQYISLSESVRLHYRHLQTEWV